MPNKKELSKTSKVMLWMCAGLEVLDNLLITPQELKKRALRNELFKSSVIARSFLHYLVRQGYIKYVNKNSEQFIKITKKGELVILLAKARTAKPAKWDGKWRVVIFDIPEASRLERNRFRRLLKDFGYRQLQASVFVSPNPLNREAVRYLKESGLVDYIRLLKVEEIDDDADLKKRFNLSR